MLMNRDIDGESDSAVIFAHSRPDAPQSEWEPLAIHLAEVAMLAERFAAEFDSANWGQIAGRLHDLGKYRPEFQRRIRGGREQVEHAGVGAALASERALLPLAFVIAGHHAGLAADAARLSSGALGVAARATTGDLRSWTFHAGGARDRRARATRRSARRPHAA